jgi:hypothetical protein
MKPTFSVKQLKKTKASEYGLRFVLGGMITACAGLVTHRWGPGVGGLFLAFPAILPASLTLVEDHEGRQQAVDDARGGRLGSVGMAVFATVVCVTSQRWPPALVLAAAAAAWLAVAVGLWFVRHGRGGR